MVSWNKYHVVVSAVCPSPAVAFVVVCCGSEGKIEVVGADRVCSRLADLRSSVLKHYCSFSGLCTLLWIWQARRGFLSKLSWLSFLLEGRGGGGVGFSPRLRLFSWREIACIDVASHRSSTPL
jgi:hypothetical protein